MMRQRSKSFRKQTSEYFLSFNIIHMLSPKYSTRAYMSSAHGTLQRMLMLEKITINAYNGLRRDLGNLTITGKASHIR